MYSTCLFCHSRLGANQVIERFPVGRRLAFDGSRGRLWVVCRECERWNLTPLEERWEAIEECERRFRATKLRMSTDNIGLARLKEGLDLIRVGSPLRPEMAAWRYGDQFGRRRRNALLAAGAGAVATAAVGIGGVVAGMVTAAMAATLLNVGHTARAMYDLRHVICRIPVENGDVLLLTGAHVRSARLPRLSTGAVGLDLTLGDLPYRLRGQTAVRAAGIILARLNRLSGSRANVRAAVNILEQQGDALQCFTYAADISRQGDHRLSELHAGVRLALEMAAHEDTERRALEGELAALEAAWREAEEIAAISDDLLPVPGFEALVRQYRS
jgi:hypothetical protein